MGRYEYRSVKRMDFSYLSIYWIGELVTLRGENDGENLLISLANESWSQSTSAVIM